MIMPSNRFEQPEEPSSREESYQKAISSVFEFVRTIGEQTGISMEESLGILDVVKGSIQLNISMNAREENEQYEEDDYDGYGT